MLSQKERRSAEWRRDEHGNWYRTLTAKEREKVESVRREQEPAASLEAPAGGDAAQTSQR